MTSRPHFSPLHHTHSCRASLPYLSLPFLSPSLFSLPTTPIYLPFSPFSLTRSSSLSSFYLIFFSYFKNKLICKILLSLEIPSLHHFLNCYRNIDQFYNSNTVKSLVSITLYLTSDIAIYFTESLMVKHPRPYDKL